jgi:integrase/recombinase XerD
MPRLSNLYRRPGSKVWYGRIIRNGVETRKSLGTTDMAEAQERLSQLRLEVIGSRWANSDKITLKAALVDYCEREFKQLKYRTRVRYAISMETLSRIIGPDTPIRQIRQATLADYESERRAEGVSTQTIRCDLTTLSSVLSHREHLEQIESNPVRPFLKARRKKGLTPSEPRIVYLTIDEEEHLL